MYRVIDQLNLKKQDLKDLVVKLTIENNIKSKIVCECKDVLKVQLLEEDIEDNNISVIDALETLDEIDQVIKILQKSIKSKQKIEKRP